MTKFLITSNEHKIEFLVVTTAEVTTFRGTPFVPNHCTARLTNGEIVSLVLSKLDGNGWGIDDPAGPDGAELNADFGGGELAPGSRGNLPALAREALAAIEIEAAV